MRFFDSHCHLEDEKFSEDLSTVLQNMENSCVERCICASSDMQTSDRIVNLTREYNQIFGTVGIHPHESKYFNQDDLIQMATWLNDSKIVGIGEIGLDYFYDLSDRDIQKSVFRKQIELAIDLDKPIMLHIRDAHGDAMDILKSYKGAIRRCVMHCYSGSAELATEYVKMGYFISFAGPITFKNANKLLQVPSVVPDDRYFIETDSPYLAPVPYRGKRNEPSYVIEVAKKIAEIKHQPLEMVAEQSYKNVCSFYDIPVDGIKNAKH